MKVGQSPIVMCQLASTIDLGFLGDVRRAVRHDRLEYRATNDAIVGRRRHLGMRSKMKYLVSGTPGGAVGTADY